MTGNTRRMGRGLASVLVTLALMWGAAVQASEPQIGAVTQQPLPRWVSMKAEEANARRGPSMHHRIDWVFKHRNMPLLVTAEHGHWRRVVDRDGVGGWVHYVMLSRARTVIVETDGLPLRRSPEASAPVVAEAQRGAIAQLSNCADGWCRISARRLKGWVPEDGIWGTQVP